MVKIVTVNLLSSLFSRCVRNKKWNEQKLSIKESNSQHHCWRSINFWLTLFALCILWCVPLLSSPSPMYKTCCSWIVFSVSQWMLLCVCTIAPKSKCVVSLYRMFVCHTNTTIGCLIVASRRTDNLSQQLAKTKEFKLHNEY